MPTDLHFFAPEAVPELALVDEAGVFPPDEDYANNAVLLVGTLTEPAEERDLAGGVKVVRWTVRVPRGAGRVGTDLVDCVALDPDLQQRGLAWPQDSKLMVLGALRRRFFRTGGRTTTRVEVEAHRVTEIVPEIASESSAEGSEESESGR